MSNRKKYYPLEPRILLDAAAITTAAEVAFDTSDTGDLVNKSHSERDEINHLVAAFSENAKEKRNEVVFIDSGIDQAQAIAANLAETMHVVMLQSNQDGVLQIAENLTQYQNVDAIHIFSHGSQGELELGNSSLNTESLTNQHQDLIAQWSDALNETADIFVYGCDVGAGEAGTEFVERLSALTKADLAASTDLTGESLLGGDWQLEKTIGEIEAQSLQLNGFEGVLTTAPTIDDAATQDRQVVEDGSLSITDITVADPEVDETIAVTIRVTDGSGDANSGTLTGTLTLATTANLTNVTGDGTGTISFEGNVADINNALNSMTLAPNENLNGDVRIAFDVNDGDQSNSLNVAVAVTAANDDPTLSPVATTVAEGATISFAAIDFGLTDPDIVSGDQQTEQMIVQLNTLPSTGTLLFNGSPVASGSVFSYDQVANLSYTHNDSDVVTGDTDSFSVIVNDGAGGTTSATLTINLTPVNKAPTISAAPTIFEGESNVALGLSVSDQESGHADAPENTTIEIVSTDLKGEGTLFLDLNNDGVIDGGETLTAGSTFTADNANLVKFTHNGNETDTADQPSIVVKVTDAGGGEGPGNELSSADTTVTFDITPVDDDPTLDTNTALNVNAGNGVNTIVAITEAQLDVSDIDSVDSNLVYTLETRPAYGVVEVQVEGDWKTLGIGGRFTQDQINNGFVRYIHEVTIADDVTDSFNFSVKDSALKAFPNAGEPGAVRDNNGDIEINAFTINIAGAGGTQIAPSDPSPGYGGTSGSTSDNATTPVATSMTNTNNGVGVINESGTGILTDAMLNYVIKSADDSYVVPADETVFTLTTLPPNGSIQIDTGGGNWVNIPIFGNFTQDDVDNGRIRFDHDGGEDFISTFDYSVSDGGPNRIDATFTLDLVPINDTPTAIGSTVEVLEASPSVSDGTVRLTTTEVSIADEDFALDAPKQVGEGVRDNLWFRASSLTVDGALQRWDGGSWVNVATDEWLSADLLSMTADGDTSGLRYVHAGEDQPANLTDSFNFEVRDDLTEATGATEVRVGQAVPDANNLSTTATVNLSVTPTNDTPIVPINSGAGDTTVNDVDSVNDTTVNNILIVGEGATETITAAGHLNAVDSDNNSVQRQFRVTDATDNGKLLKNGSALGVGSTFTQADIDNGLLTYKHDGSENFSDSFNFVVSDGVGTTAVSTFDITVTPRNDAVTLTAPTSVDFFTTTAYDFTNSITIDDPDLLNVAAGETDFIQATLDLKKSGVTYAGGTITLGSTNGIVVTSGVNDVAGGLLVFQGAMDDVQAALTGLTIQVPADENATLALDITIDDRLRDGSGTLIGGANGGATNEDESAINTANNAVTNTIAIQASNSNDAPTIPDIPANVSVNEDASINFTGGNQIQIADIDAFGQDVSVTLSASNGDLTLVSAELISAGANDSGSITLTGSVAAINTALLGLSYQGDSQFNGNDTLNVSVNDGGNSGPGGNGIANDSVAITVTPVNDTPTLTVPDIQDYDNGASFVFSSGNNNLISIADPNDSGELGFTDNVQVTLAIDDGTLELASTVGITFEGGTNDNEATIVLSGSLANVNAALDGLAYTPSDTNLDGINTLTVTMDDLANGGTAAGGVGNAETVMDTVQIRVSGTNDAPVVTAPVNNLSVNEDAILTLTGAGNIFSFSDTDDFGASDLVATVTATNGTLTLVANDGATIGGSSTEILTITGTKAQINSALDGLQFTPDGDYHGDAQITVSVNDAGNLGNGGAQNDSESITVTVNAVNDRPDAAGTVTLATVNEDLSSPAGILISTAVNATYYSDDTDDQTGNGGNDSESGLGFIAIIGNSATANQGSWEVSDGVGGWISVPTDGLSSASALIVSADRDIRFVPAADFHGTPGSLTARLADSDGSNTVTVSANAAELTSLGANGGTGQTGAWSSGSVSIGTSVSNVNDRPTAIANAALAAVNEDTTAPVGDSVSNLFSPVFSDSDDNQTSVTGGGDASSALGGIAIVANDATAGEGEWQYNTGGGWNAVATGGLSDNAAIILPNDADIRFVPASDFNGVPGNLTIRMADSLQVFSAAADISGDLTQTDTWSDTFVLNTNINAINDAPELSGTATNPVIVENANAGTGTNELALITGGGASDIDGVTASFGGGQLVITFTNGYQAGDTLSVTGSPAGVASMSGGSASDLIINLNSSATESTIGAILDAIRFENTSDNPTNFGNDTDRDYQITLNDGNNNNTAGGPTPLNSSNNLSGTITFTPVDDAPVGVNDTGGVSEDTNTSSTGNVLSNDTDLDTQVLTVTEVEGLGGNVNNSVAGTYGEITLDSAGDYTYNLTNANPAVQALAAGETLTDTFNYTVSDGNETDTAAITITITGTNDTPVVDMTDLTAGVVELVTAVGNLTDSGSISFTDTDITDTHTATVTATSAVPLGALTPTVDAINGEIDWVYSVAATAVEYLAEGETKVETFTITLNDGNGGTVDRTVSVTITGTNDVPVPTADTDTTDEDNAVIRNAAAGVIPNDADTDDSDTLTVTQITNGVDTVAFGNPIAGTNGGSFTINDDGSYSFDPATDFQNLAVGESDTTTVTYTVSDGNGGTNTAILTMTVNGVNDAPVTTADTDTTNEDSAINRDAAAGVIPNDSDTDSTDILTVSQITNGVDTVAFGNPITGTNGGSFTLNADGSYSFDPGADFQNLAVGESDTTTVTYTVSDGNGGTETATLTITVNGVNDAPVPTADTDTTDEDNAVIRNAAAGVIPNDTDADSTDILTVTQITNGSDTVAFGNAITGTNGGSFTINADGSYNFDPGADFQALAAGESDTTTVTYTVSDGNGGTNTAILTMTVNGVNDAPVTTADTDTTNEDSAINRDAAAGVIPNDSDTDSTDILTVSQITNGVDTVAFGNPITGTNGGSFTLNADGSYSFDPGADFQNLAVGESDTTTVIYTVSDGNGGTETATLTITMNGVNDAPVPTADTDTTDEDNAVIRNAAAGVIPNDADADDSDTLTVTQITNGVDTVAFGNPIAGTNGGSFTINDDGSYSFDPATDFQNLAVGESDTTTVTYTVSDGNGGTNTAILTMTVNGVNDAPVTTADTDTTNEDSTINRDAAAGVIPNDSDTDSTDILTVSQITNGVDTVAFGNPITGTNGGSFTLNADGSYSFDPGADFQNLAVGESDTTTVTYTVSDGNGGTETATLTITVNGVNDAPVPTADTDTTDEDNAVIRNAAAGVIPNDTDADSTDILTVTQITNGSDTVAFGNAITGTNGGSFTINADGSYNFDPGADFQALAAGESDTTTVTYTVSDGNGGTNTAILTMTVNGVNDAPVTTADTDTTNEDSAINRDAAAGVIPNDSDTDSTDILTVSQITNGVDTVAFGNPITGTNGGSFTLNADGSYSFDPGADFQNLAVGESDTTTVTYTVSDGNGGTETATLTITVNGVNDAPVPTADTDTTDEDNAVIRNAAAGVIPNDADADDSDTLTVTQITNGVDTVAFGNPIAGTNGGSFTINDDGSYSFDPATDFQNLAVGESDTTTVTYTVSDGNGGTNTAILTMTVNGVNDAPVTTADTDTTNEDSTINRDAAAGVIPNDSDTDSTDILTVSQITNGVDTVAFGNPITGTNGGSFTLNADGSYSFDPGADFQNLAVGESDTTTVTYTVSDGNGGTETATLTITVNGVNDAPVPTADTDTTDEDNAVIRNAAAGVIPNDADADSTDILTVTQITNGSDTVAFGNAITGTNGGSFTINADGSYNFDPGADFQALAAGESDTTTVTYTVSDGNGGTNTAILTMTVNGVNDAPVTTADTDTTNEDSAINRDAAAGVIPNDSDTDSTDILTVSQITNGVDTVAFGNPITGTNGGSFTLNADGSYSFDPGADFQNLAVGESDTTTVTYTVSDGNGGTETATLTITVNGVNDAPVPTADTDTTDEDNAVIRNAAAGVIPNDADADDSDTLTVTQITNGVDTVAFGNPIAGTNGGSFTINDDGSYSFDPATDFQNLAVGESDTTTVTYTVSDGNGGTNTAILTMTVNGVNDAPVTTADTDTTNEDSTINRDAAAGVIPNDSDTDSTDILTVSQITNGVDTVAFGNPITGTNGGSFTLNADGSYSFDPGTDFQNLAVGESDTTTVTYTVSDGNGGTETATLTITVNGVNDAPIASTLPTQSSNDAEVINVDVTSYFSDVDTSDDHTYTATGLPPGLMLDLNTGVISGTVANNASTSGPYTVEITADDGNGRTVTTNFSWVVTNVAPSATNNTASVTEEISLLDSGNVLTDDDGSSTDSDPDGDVLFISEIEGNASDVGSLVLGQFGDITLNTNGSYTYNLDNTNTDVQSLAVGESLSESFVYTVSDGQGGTDTASLTVIIEGTNDVPTASVIPNQSGNDAQVISLDVTSYFSDLDSSDDLTYTATGLPDGLMLDLTSGVISGTIISNASVSGPYTIEVTADDGNGGSVNTSFTWNVLNLTPIAINNSASVTEESNLIDSGNVLTDDDGIGVDSDPDGDALIVTEVEGRAGSVGVELSGVFGDLTLNSDGSYDYVMDNTNIDIQALAVGETLTESFSYTINDNQGGTDTALLTLTINGTNDSPTVVSIPAQSNNDADVVNLDIGRYFSDIDTNDIHSYTATGLPVGLVLDSNTGLISGTIDPAASVSGPYVVEIMADDGNGGTVLTSLTWNVTNTIPTASDNQGSVVEDSRISDSGNVLSDDDGSGVDLDSDDDLLVVSAVQSSATNVGTSIASTYGSLVLNSDGSYNYYLNNDNPDVQALEVGESLTESFTYTVSDGQGGTDTAELSIVINGQDDPIVDTPSDPDGSSDQVTSPFDFAPNLGDDDDKDNGDSDESNNIRQEVLDEFAFNDKLNSELLNPISMNIVLEDKVFRTDKVHVFSLPENTFQHTDPNENISITVALDNGNPLPSIIAFDDQSLSFEVDAPKAAQQGEFNITIRVTGEDSKGNSVSSTFTIDLLEEEEEALKLPGAEADIEQLMPNKLTEEEAETSDAENSETEPVDEKSDAQINESEIKVSGLLGKEEVIVHSDLENTDDIIFKDLQSQLEGIGRHGLEQARIQLLDDIKTLFS